MIASIASQSGFTTARRESRHRAQPLLHSPSPLLNPPSASRPRTDLANFLNHSFRRRFGLIRDLVPLIKGIARLSVMPGGFMAQTLLIQTAYTLHVPASIRHINLARIAFRSLALKSAQQRLLERVADRPSTKQNRDLRSTTGEIAVYHSVLASFPKHLVSHPHNS